MEFNHITLAVIARRFDLELRITQAKSLNPNRPPDEWAKSNKTGQGNLPDLLGLGPEVGEGEAWEHLTALIQKVWFGEQIVMPPIASMNPIGVPVPETQGTIVPPPTITPLEESGLPGEFTPLNMPTAAPEVQLTELEEQLSLEQESALAEEHQSPVGSELVGLDLEKPETWEHLLNNWAIAEFANHCREVLEKVSAEELTRAVIVMLQKISEYDPERFARLGPLKQFFSTASVTDVGRFWLVLQSHLADLQSGHQLGHPAAEVALWNEDFFFFLANNIRQNARSMTGLQRDLQNDPVQMTEMAIANMKDWRDHIDIERHPESWAYYSALAEYRLANEAQFDEKLREIFDRLVASQP